MNKSIGLACNIKTGKLDANQAVKGGAYPFFTCAEFPDEIDHFAFDADVALVAGNNAQGNFHVSRFTGKFNAYQRTYVLSAKDGFDIDYIYYALKLELKRLREKSQGSQTKFLTMPILTGIHLQDLNFDDQSAISGALRALDAKIDCNNRINAELEAIAKTLYDYWFVQFDFPDANGKPYESSGGKMAYNATLKREIPAGWEIGNVSELCYLNHHTWSNKDHPDQVSYLDLANANNGEILGVQNFDWYDAPSRARRILSPGDTIVGTVRPGNRSFALVPKSEEILTGSTGFAVLTPKSAIYREFNYLSLTSESNINRLTTIASGAAYPAVNPEAVAALSIAIPGKDLVKEFHKTTSSLFDLLERHRDQKQYLTQLRDWLLPLLMNGQVTVK